jgi:hypothetical protein
MEIMVSSDNINARSVGFLPGQRTCSRAIGALKHLFAGRTCPGCHSKSPSFA